MPLTASTPTDRFPVVIVGAGLAGLTAALHLAAGDAQWWLGAGWRSKVPALAGLVLGGAAVYGVCLLALGFRVRDFSRRGAE